LTTHTIKMIYFLNKNFFATKLSLLNFSRYLFLWVH
jgi:hypothetical protein